jgi:type I restriction enzyme S subunit
VNENWKYGVLADAVDKASSNISLNKINNEDGDYPVYGAKGFVQNVSFFHQEKEYLAIIKDGAGIGRVSKHPEKSSVVATMQYLIPKEGFDISFVEYFLNSIDFEKHRNGSTIPHIYFKDYKSEPFPILPLPEQKRIVAILDEAFAGIDQAIANTEKNLASARELFESYMGELFRVNRENWPQKKFKEICGFVRGPFGGSLKKSCFVEDGIAVYEQQHAINNQFEHIRYFIDDDKFEEMKRFELLPNDLIMSCSGTMGKVAIVPSKARKGIINQALLKLTPNKNIRSEFLKLWMESNDFQDQLKLHTKGVAIKNVASVKVLKEIEAPLPSIEEQQRIIERLQSSYTETEKLVVVYKTKLNSLNELKQSLLQKAFSGELTADMDTQAEAVA